MTQKSALSTIALALGLAWATTQAHADTITFETLAVGTTLSNQYPGVTFAPSPFTGAGSSTSGEDWATNTDMTIVSSTGTDVGGLGTPALVSGNILRSFAGWLNEDGDPSFSITFAAGASNFSANFAGVSTGADVTLYAYNGVTLVGTVSGTGTGQITLSYGGAFTRIAVRPGSFNDWVGVDNISFTPGVVPEASTWAMMGLGLALLALKRRQPR